MTAQDLKNSILQLAVQGKLVPQNPSDEPASELLKRIADERTRRMAEGTLVVDKKHTASPITADDILYDLPENWKWTRFADIVTFSSGKTPQRQNTAYWSNVEYPWVSIADMQADSLTTTTKEQISEAAFEDCFSGKIAPAGTMIMSFKLTIGKVSILGMDAVHNEAIISIYPTAPVGDSRILQKWLFKILPLVAATGNSKNAIKGKTLNAISMSNLMIPVPPLAEQERIVAKLEELLPFVSEYDKTEKRLSALNDEFPDKLRKSILQQAVQGKLTERDPSDEPASELLKRIQTEKAKLITEGKIKKEKALLPIAEDDCPFEIPGTWKWVKFGGIADFCLGKMLDKAKNQGNLHPYLRNVNVRWGFFDFEDILKMRFKDDEEERYSVKYGDLVVCEGGEPGRCAVWTDVSQTFRIQKALHRVRFIGDVDSFYAYRVFEYYASNGYFAKRFTGETIKHLPGEVLKNIAFPLPPIAEQKRIVVRINELLAICDGLKHVR